MLTPPQAAFHDTPVGLERIRGAGTLLLAVSGGPDSMGMLQALAALRGAEGAPLIEVATVDHGLRPESADEAAMVSRECASFGLTHHILRIAAPPHRGVQANARFLRYRLLAACARERSLDTIVTAHHEGDQAETIAMRLAHRSGPEGLAGIRRHSIFDGVPVLRPFLDWPAAGLRALSAMGPCVDDPSNRDLRYERVRVREVLGAVAAERLLRLGGRAERLRSRREAARHAAIAAHWRLLPSGHASIPLATLAGM
ncbi:MAG: tRNA lysidine(34) synthetase TilS, partial [Flavobacteriaceae bacterium]